MGQEGRDGKARQRYDAIVNRIAIYDLDKTITRRATYTPFLFHAATKRQQLRLFRLPFVLLALALFAFRVIDRGRLKEWNQALLLGSRIARAELDPIVASFVARMLADNIWDAARAQIAEDRASGHRLVLATASYRFYAEPLARALGFDDVVATESAFDADGQLCARIDGENCYGAAKLRMVAAWAAACGLDRCQSFIRFYSDHVSDAPCFAWADQRFAVNAHGPLRELARASGWTLLDWRKPPPISSLSTG
jgi:HAD superfamily hydrolase (TIGR01490 family)